MAKAFQPGTVWRSLREERAEEVRRVSLEVDDIVGMAIFSGLLANPTSCVFGLGLEVKKPTPPEKKENISPHFPSCHEKVSQVQSDYQSACGR